MKTYQRSFFMGLVALLIVALGAGCGSGSGIQASWTKTEDDGTKTKQEVTIGSTEKKEEAPKKAASEKTVVERLGELEVAVADINAKTAALKLLLGADGTWVELDKSGDLQLSSQARQLLEDPKAKTETKTLGPNKPQEPATAEEPKTAPNKEEAIQKTESTKRCM